MYVPSLVITRETLKTLINISLKSDLPSQISDFSYDEFHYAMTINSLIKYCEEFGIDLPFQLDLKD